MAHRWIGVAMFATGCLYHGADRPARLELGMSSRHLAASAPTPSPDATNLARATSTTPDATAGAPGSAVTGSLQFTMALQYHAYIGGEVETGTLGPTGSNFAAAYGIVGGETGSHLGSVAVELAAGRRSLRADMYAGDHASVVFEPRVRGEVWLSSQLTLGGAVGASLSDHAWMAGLYLGVHSHLFDFWK